MPQKTYAELVVWQKAMDLAISVYAHTRDLPKAELYGLTSQMRRAGISIPSNIAEGFKKRGIRDKIRFYNIAQGSLEECRYYLILARDLGYENPQDLFSKVKSVQNLLGSYIGKLDGG